MQSPLVALYSQLLLSVPMMQYSGFRWLWERGVHFEGSSGAGQFLYVIFGLHALHVIGGIVALLVCFAPLARTAAL